MLTILGSTGSIGRQTLDVVQCMGKEFGVYALVANNNLERMEEQARKFGPKFVVMMDREAARQLKERLKDVPVTVLDGMEGTKEVVTAPEVQIVVSAFSGRIGLEPTLAALKEKKTVALANKETLVAAGELVMATARRAGSVILPIDSEHSAVFQCLAQERKEVSKIILTASGGPFLGWSREELASVKPQDALRHPNWDMGAKITIDSATMMNKGLEVIEAHHLFDMEYDAIEVLIHPQSVVHSMVEYRDGVILAQLGQPDMRVPIQYALTYPKRRSNPFERLDLRGKELSFEEPDLKAFPALALAYKVGRRGGTLPAVMNAANEVAVLAFLKGHISYLKMQELVEEVVAEHQVLGGMDLETILNADAWARERTYSRIFKSC